MKKKLRKWAHKNLAYGALGFLVLGFGVGSSLAAGECSHSGKCQCGSRTVPNIQHEMVPHVVLPETIQYHSVAKNLRRPNFDLERAGDYGMISPYVASYVPYPSYQVPQATEMKQVNQAVYPVSPKMLPLPLPAKKSERDETSSEAISETAQNDKDAVIEAAIEEMESDSILLAAGSEEIVPATPLAPYDNEVMQTGIFCQKPAKPPAAWSFSSPLFKVASVPMGWGQAGHEGYILQQGPRGCVTQVGFNPMAGGMAQPGMMPQGMMPQGGMMPPMQTFQMGRNAGAMHGIQAATLPNGMVLLTAPPDHSNCGLLRCRCGNMPRMAILPPGPAGMPGMQPQIPGQAMMGGMPMMGGSPILQVGMNGMQNPMMQNPMVQQQMMMQAMQQQMMQQQMQQQMMMQAAAQPRMMPVTMMTPYGPMFAGYQIVPGTNPMMMGGMGMYGMGMMPAEYAQQLMQAQMQPQTDQQQDKPLRTASGTQAVSASGEGKEEQELKTPLSINNQTFQGNFVNPYAMYGGQFMPNGTPSDDTQNAANGNAENAAGMTNPMMNPMLAMASPMNGSMMSPMMNPYMNPMMMSTMNQPFGGMQMMPYGMAGMNPMMFNPMGMNSMAMMNPMMGGMMGYGMPGMMGHGMMPVGMNGGMNMQERGDNVTVSDLIQIMMLMNQMNKPEPRQGPIRRLFARLRGDDKPKYDPFQQMMQAWSTPYYSPDTAMRMPSRNAYPYGYFGAQVGGMDTSNYGGYYNLHMGNSAYPGLY